MSAFGAAVNMAKVGFFLVLETPFRPRWAVVDPSKDFPIGLLCKLS
jgi:hypothetical protein